jgi:predicted DNA-binding transcriptional regulator YafY
MLNPATRLITLIQLLQRQPNQKAAELASELGVSVRTLHRYLVMLGEMGIPVYSERGPYGGFSLVRGYKMPPLVFSPEEAVAVCLGTSLVEEMWGRIYQEAARSALAKIENLLPDEQRHEAAWARRSLLATGMHRADLEALAPNLEKLRRAAREHRQVQLTYHGSNQQSPTRRKVDPYVLVHRWGWWYLIGFCHLRQALRTFRLDRVMELTLLDVAFDPPVDFDLHAYLQSEQQTQLQVIAQMRFPPNTSQAALDNRLYWQTLDEQADGSIVVSFSAPTLEWAASTALAYGPIVEVLEPLELRKLVADWAASIAKTYSIQSR